MLDALSQIVEKFVGRMRGAVAAPSGSAEDVADFWRRSAYVNKLTGALIRQKQKVMARLAVVEAWTAAPEDIDAFHLWSRAAEFRRTRNDRGDWYAARSAITVLGLGFRDLALGAIHASTFGVFDLKPALPDSSAFTAGAILGTPIVGVAQAKVLGFLAREVATAARISASVSSRVVGPAMKAFAESVRKATATLGGRLGTTAKNAAVRAGDAADTNALLDVLANRPGDVRPFKFRTVAAFEGSEIGVAPRSVSELGRTERQIAEGLERVRAETRFIPEGSAKSVTDLATRVKTADAEIGASVFEHLQRTGGRFITGDFDLAQALHRVLGFPKGRIVSVRDWDPKNLLVLFSLGGVAAAGSSRTEPLTPEHQ